MPSYTKAAAILVVFASYQLTIAAPTPAPRPVPDITNQLDNAYSGTAGDASGGSIKTLGNTAGANIVPGSNILNGGSLLKLFSGNAGKGGKANSGSASPPPVGNLDVTGTTTSTNADGTTVTGNAANTIGNAYSGTGGIAKGGDVENSVGGGLIDLFSDNAGSGGDASSGSSGNGAVMLSKKLSGVGRTRVSRVIRLYLD